MKKRWGLFGILCVVVMVFFSACDENTEAELTKKTYPELLGTVISVSTYEQIDEKTFDDIFDMIADIDARMTTNSTDSEIAHINGKSGIEPVAVSQDVYELAEMACEFSDLSEGAFDVTIGPVMELWKVNGEFIVLPEEEKIEEKRSLVGYEKMALSENGIMLEEEGMMLDFGGIAKGYACDKTLEYLIAEGFTSALLDFGGNIYAHGLKPDGSLWRIGVAVPLVGENNYACVVNVQDMAVVTSGGYERYFESDGVLYHHILDPKTGYPVNNELLSVTIIDPSSAKADALSTSCFVLGLQDGYKLLEDLDSSEGIFITKDYMVYATSGLKEVVNVVDERFQLSEYE